MAAQTVVHELEQQYREATGEEAQRLKKLIQEACSYCQQYKGKMAPSHFGSGNCQSGSLASGGTRSHCSCDTCF